MNDPSRRNRRPEFAPPAPKWGAAPAVTRVMRTTMQVDPRQSGVGTVVFGSTQPVQAWTPRGGFQGGLHRLIRSAVLEERRPGLFVFAATVAGQLAGRLWLAATDDVRAGTVGRHELVDLPVAPDAALSLRHFLFVVRRVGNAVRFSAIDLETPAGLHTRHGQQRSVQAERPVLLRTAGLCFWCVPTGPGASVPEDSVTAWAIFNDAPPPRLPSLFERIVQRPPSARGSLRLTLDARSQSLPVDAEMVAKGLLLGRNERCDVVIPDSFASRVHVALLEVDEVLHVIDTGSSNGTWTISGERVRCRPLQDGDVFCVGAATLQWCEVH